MVLVTRRCRAGLQTDRQVVLLSVRKTFTVGRRRSPPRAHPAREERFALQPDIWGVAAVTSSLGRTESAGGLGRVLGSSHSTPLSSGIRFQKPGVGLASLAVWRRRRSQKTTLAAQAVFSSHSYLRQLRRPRASPPCSQAHPTF